MNALAKNPIPVEQAHTYAHGMNPRVSATAVKITGDLNTLLSSGGLPSWFITAAEAGLFSEDTQGRLTFNLPKGREVKTLVLRQGSWLVKTNVASDLNGFDVLTDEGFHYLYKRVPVQGDWVFSLGGGNGTALIEHVTSVAFIDRLTPVVIHTHARAKTSPIRLGWRFAETQEIQAQAHKDSVAFKQFWGLPLYRANADKAQWTPDQMVKIIEEQAEEINNLKLFIAGLKTE